MRFVLLMLAVPFLGWWAGIWPSVRRLPLAARVAVFFATGTVTIVVEMFLLALVGLRWSTAMLVTLPLLLNGVAVLRRSHAAREKSDRLAMVPLIVIALSVAVLTAAVLAGGITSGDYVFFWGVKGQRFGQERLLDVAFTLVPTHYMHPDYPPLVPLLYAWTMLGGARAFDWWGGMLTAPLFLLLSSATIWGFGRYARIRNAESFAAFFAALYALFYIRNACAGNAEPALNFFEVVSLAAITFWRERTGEHDFIAAIALMGVALTKVEGGVFVALVLATTWIARQGSWRERFVAGVKMGMAPVVALVAWLVFGRFRGLTDTYVPREDLSLRYMGITIAEMVRELSLHLWYIPWIVLAIVLFTGRLRAAIPHVVAAIGFIIFLLLVYTRAEPHLEWSAGRTLMSPVLLTLFGVMASQRERLP